MTPHEYLTNLLNDQELKGNQLASLRTIRDEIEGWLRVDVGSGVRFYYGGSFAKKTMLREGYDLDIILYFPHTEASGLSEIFNRVHRRLAAKYTVVPRTVALRLTYTQGFHVDVVPGKAQNATFKYATLFKNTRPSSTLQTSVKVHIESVKDAGLSDIVRLTKLWRLRHGLDVATFALEIAIQKAMSNVRRDNLGTAMLTVLRYLANDFVQARLVDPANTNNVVEVPAWSREVVASKAKSSIAQSNWGQIVY